MSVKHFDVIVLGENLSGIMTAALMAARRYSVLWIRKAALSPQGYLLGPSARRDPLLYPGIFERPALAAVARELNLGHKLRSIFKPANPLFQMVDAHHRLDLAAERLALVAELQREFGAGIRPDAIAAFLDREEALGAVFDKLLTPTLPVHTVSIKQYFEKRKRMAEFVRGARQLDIWPLEQEIEAPTPFDGLWSGPDAFLAPAREGFNPIFKGRRLNGVWRENLYRVGLDSLEAILFERFETHGGKHLDELTLVESEANRHGFRFFDGKTAYTSDLFVAAFDHFLLGELFPTSRQATRYAAQAAKILTPSHAVAKVSFLVSRRVIPDEMAHTVFLDHDITRPHEPLLIQRDPLLTEAAELERLDVFSWIRSEELEAASLRQVENRVIERMNAFLPFLPEFVRKIYLDQAPGDDVRGTPWALAGRRLGYTATKPRGVWRGLPFKLPVRNGYLAGPEVLPELGMEGEFLLSLQLARAMALRKPRKDDLGGHAG